MRPSRLAAGPGLEPGHWASKAHGLPLADPAPVNQFLNPARDPGVKDLYSCESVPHRTIVARSNIVTPGEWVVSLQVGTQSSATNSQRADPKFLSGGNVGLLMNVQIKKEIGVLRCAVSPQPVLNDVHHCRVAIHKRYPLVCATPRLDLRSLRPI